jgi:hypothetical protein
MLKIVQGVFRNSMLFQLLETDESQMLDVRVDLNFNQVRSRIVQGDGLQLEPLRPVLYITPPKSDNRNTYLALLLTATGAKPVYANFTIKPSDIPAVPKGVLHICQTVEEVTNKLLAATRAVGTVAYGVPMWEGAHAYLGVQIVAGDARAKLLFVVASKRGTVDAAPMWKLLQIDERSGIHIPAGEEAGEEPPVFTSFQSALAFESEMTTA